MKTKIFKRIMAVVLTGVVAGSLCSCGVSKGKTASADVKAMKEEAVHSLSFDFLGGEDVMPIGGYYGPSTRVEFNYGRKGLDHYTDEVFSLIAESGVNLVISANADYAMAKDYVYKQLELGEKYNVGLYVTDSMISVPIEGSPITTDDLDTRLLKYSDYASFCGVTMPDEPTSQYYRPELEDRYSVKLAPAFKSLKELGQTGSVNLNPIKSGTETDYENYRKYVEEFCSTCDPNYLCFDYYLWDSDTTTEGFFYNLSIIREYAEKYEIPFWCFIQAGGQWNDDKKYFDSAEYYPTEGQLLWNVNTALACGAKGINYFPMIQPIHFAYAQTNEFDFQRNGLIGAMGNKTQWFYYAQKANQQIKAVDSVLMNAVNKGVIVNGKKAKAATENFAFVMEENSWRELESVEGNALVGCFNYHGKTALYVTNYEYEYAQKITLNLLDSYNVSITQNAETTRVNTDTLVLDMKAGEGALVVFE